MSLLRVARIGCCSLLIVPLCWAQSGPVAVSPGDASRLALIESRCPTFTWGEVEGTESYELAVYRLGDEDRQVEPVLRQRFAGSVYGWTPSLEQCLERGSRYGWSVRAVDRKGRGGWSSARLFEVASSPDASDLRTALDAIARLLEADPSQGDALPIQQLRAGFGARESVDSGAPAVSGIREGPHPKALNAANIGIWAQAAGTGVRGDGGRGVHGHASAFGGTGVWGSTLIDGAVGVKGTATDDGFGGLFVNTGTGPLLAANDQDSTLDLEFVVHNDGLVEATAFAGDGSALHSLGVQVVPYHVQQVSPATDNLLASCGTGEALVGGGCNCWAGATVVESHPNAAGDAWQCNCSALVSMEAWAFCVSVP